MSSEREINIIYIYIDEIEIQFIYLYQYIIGRIRISNYVLFPSKKKANSSIQIQIRIESDPNQILLKEKSQFLELYISFNMIFLVRGEN